jgi:hypothetical protein
MRDDDETAQWVSFLSRTYKYSHGLNIY